MFDAIDEENSPAKAILFNNDDNRKLERSNSSPINSEKCTQRVIKEFKNEMKISNVIVDREL